MTYPCPICKRPHLTQADAKRCCAKGRPCPTCNGKGIITGGAFVPNQTCSRCGGSGVI